MTIPQGSPQEAPSPSTERPKEIDLATQFWWATLVLSLIGMVIRTFTIPGAVLAQFRLDVQHQGIPISDAQLNETLLIGQIASVVIYAGLCVLWVLFILKMRAGRHWARMVLSGLGWLSVIVNVLFISTDQISAMVFYLVTAIVEIVAIVAMFRGPANAYFLGKAQPPGPR